MPVYDVSSKYLTLLTEHLWLAKSQLDLYCRWVGIHRVDLFVVSRILVLARIQRQALESSCPVVLTRHSRLLMRGYACVWARKSSSHVR